VCRSAEAREQERRRALLAPRSGIGACPGRRDGVWEVLPAHGEGRRLTVEGITVGAFPTVSPNWPNRAQHADSAGVGDWPYLSLDSPGVSVYIKGINCSRTESPHAIVLLYGGYDGSCLR
jgi:hypothetical protein